MSKTVKTSNGAELMENYFVVPTEGLPDVAQTVRSS